MLSNDQLNLLICPIDWQNKLDIGDKSDPGGIDYGPLIADWLYCLEQHCISSEEVLLAQDYYYGTDIDGSQYRDLKSVFENLRNRRPQAINQYMKRSGKLSGLIFLTPSEHMKHFMARATKKQINSASKEKSISYFYNDCPSAGLSYAFWFWFISFFGEADSLLNDDLHNVVRMESSIFPNKARVWKMIMSSHQMRIAFNAGTSVGATNGKSTEFICYDIHFDNKIAHAYPVNEDEAKKIMESSDIEYVDSLQGYFQ